LIKWDGTVADQVQASSPATVTCGDAGAAVVPPPVSTSNDLVYFMDADGVVRSLPPAGAAVRATTVPVGSNRRSIFSVSPDDKRIAVVVSDFTSSGATNDLYVEDLNGGGHHRVIFTETGAFGLWPMGWHGADIVVAKVPACSPGGAVSCCVMLELHVVDATTGARKGTLGGAGCIIAGPPSPSGAICESDTLASVMDWTGTTTRSISIQGPTPAYLSPNGNQAAMVGASDTVVEGTLTTFAGFKACGWIDSARLLAGDDAHSQPRVADDSTGMTVSVSALGTCAGRIPGGL
jgi:hypothetical protein